VLSFTAECAGALYVLEQQVCVVSSETTPENCSEYQGLYKG
jgi:hypothetical protein